MMNLLDEQSLDKIAENVGTRLWKGFVTFGSASAGVLAVFIIVRFIKLIIDTIIHGYALSTDAAFISYPQYFVIHLLLHLGKINQNGARRPKRRRAA